MYITECMYTKDVENLAILHSSQLPEEKSAFPESLKPQQYIPEPRDLEAWSKEVLHMQARSQPQPSIYILYRGG